MTTTHSATLKKSLLAFVLGLTAIPFSGEISPQTLIDGQLVYLAWLPLSVMMALMLLFGRLAVVPIIVASLIVNALEWPLDALQNVLLVICQTQPTFLFCGLIYLMLGKRWRFGLPNKKMGVRLFWLSFMVPAANKILMYSVGGYVVFPPGIAAYFDSDSVTFRIIDVLSLIAASLMFTMVFYYLLRMILNPRYARTLWRICIVPYITPRRRAFSLSWIATLAALLILLCSPYESELIGGYLVPSIFVVFTIGIRKFGHRFITVSWAISAYLLLRYNRGFLHGLDTEFSLAFVLSVFISFSLCILFMSSIFRKSEWVKRLWHDQALTDPLTQLPNLRALEQYLQQNPVTQLCCLRMNNLEFLSRHYGMMMRVHAKRTINREIEELLHDGEQVFQLPGNELMINLNGPDPEQRLTHIVDLLNSRKIYWHNNPIDIEFSAAWGVMEPDIPSVQTLLGQLSYLAEQASRTDRVLSLNASKAVVSGQTSERVFMLQKVKRALDEESIVLLAQPIVDAEGKGYREILTRLICDDELITPDKFLPIVAQFNLSARFDFLVLEKTLAWLQSHPDDSAAPCFSVNLMPYTLIRKETAQHVIALFDYYGVPTHSVIIEITEEQAFSDSETSIQNIIMLREAGFRIAIDDFGTGYANYERLKSLQADIIKIDGCFIKDILTDSMDAMIVKSICQMASVKSLSVVAEFVETPEQRELLLQQGVHYLQGYLLGKPEPLASLPA